MRIAVDLTGQTSADASGEPVAGAQVLLQRICQAAPDLELLLLCGPDADLVHLDASNVQRVHVAPGPRIGGPTAPPAWMVRLRDRVQLRSRVRRALGVKPRVHAGGWSRLPVLPRRATPPPLPLLRQHRVDVVLCPFTSIGFYERGLPLISFVHDLEFHTYPHLLRPEVGEARRRAFADACWLAERLVCCSEHLREEVIRAGHLSDERVVSLSPGVLAPGVGDVAASAGATPGLERGEFLVYPADFRPSKNHALLLTAFGMYRARHPESPLKLVCVGQPDGGSPALREAVQRMGLARWVLLIEHASQSRRRALLDGCRAVIYPSLYEASGQGIVEAIAAGKPLLCSHTPALAEVAQDAAVYFDPRRPDEIAHALDSMTSSEALAGLASRTRQRAATLEHEVEQAVTTCLAVVRAAAGQAARRLPQASRHGA